MKIFFETQDQSERRKRQLKRLRILLVILNDLLLFSHVGLLSRLLRQLTAHIASL